MEEEALAKAPEFCLNDHDGRRHCLAHHGGHLLLLVFVRHYACACCRAHLLHLQSRLVELHSLGVDVVVVSPESPEAVRAYARELGLSFAVLSDVQRETYRLYGLDLLKLPSRGFLRTLLDRLSTTGVEPAEEVVTEEDRLLGGDFILDEDGLVRFAYLSRYPSDRPSVSLLLAVLRELARLQQRTTHNARRGT